MDKILAAIMLGGNSGNLSHPYLRSIMLDKISKRIPHERQNDGRLVMEEVKTTAPLPMR
ncbi:MAG: hypothetical protein JWP36_752 [Paucimonas sp.]|nr:hypothetical protein [Paucimonas sp.]